MRTRLGGVLVIMRTLAPILALLVIGVTSLIAVRSVDQSSEDYQQAIDREFGTIENNVERAGLAIEDVGIFVQNLSDSIAASADVFSDAADLRVEVGTFEVAIPGADELAAFFERAGQGIVERGDELRCDLRAIAWLAGPTVRETFEPLPGCPEPEAGPLGRLSEATGEFRDDTTRTLQTWVWVVLATLALALLAWVSTNRREIGVNLRRGGAMMRGVAVPSPPTTSELHQRIAALESPR